VGRHHTAIGKAHGFGCDHRAVVGKAVVADGAPNAVERDLEATIGRAAATCVEANSAVDGGECEKGEHKAGHVDKL
jgi:hypothetical protein